MTDLQSARSSKRRPAERNDRQRGGASRRRWWCAARRPHRSFLVALFAAVLGSALLALAVPRLVAAFYLLPGDPGMALLDSGQLPSPAAFERLIASRRAAAVWVAAPSTLIDLGVATMSLAQVTPDRRPTLLHQAERYLGAGLAVAPADPHAWTYLTFIHTATGDHERAARALDLALRTGPYQPELVLPRAALGLTNWPWLDQRTAAQLGVEFAHALRLAPDHFVADVLNSRRSADVRAALAGAPASQRAFDHQLDLLGRPSLLGDGEQ